ncbi:MAG: PrsW family intramembrane metalloprotease [Ruminococcus sp.]|nr:PrsW family intramembrane metalloprotease [Ruminococcus sp.]
MLLSILIFLLSIVPSVLIFIWLRSRHKDDTLYKKNCNSAFIRGLISALPVVVLSAVLFFLNAIIRLSLFPYMDNLLYKAIYTFVVLAFVEEIVKYTVFRLLLKKKNYAYTWADVAAVMVIVGVAFGLIEDIPYAIGSNPIEMLVRGFTMGHVGYGFIMGWFYGKRLYTGKKGYGVIAVLLPWLIHGLYDFSLTPELIELNDNFAVLGVSLALADIVLLILMIRFFVRSKKKERYQQPVLAIEQV